MSMNRDEQIINEAKKHYYDDINCHNAFLHGVEWADEHPVNVWHNASEEPEGTYSVLCDGSDDMQWVVGYLYVDMAFANWKDYAESINVIRWAYINDLLPKGDKE